MRFVLALVLMFGVVPTLNAAEEFDQAVLDEITAAGRRLLYPHRESGVASTMCQVPTIDEF